MEDQLPGEDSAENKAIEKVSDKGPSDKIRPYKKRDKPRADQSFAGLSAFCKWILVGVVLAAGFAYGNDFFRVVIACLLFIWVLAGPFLLSWALVDLSSRAFLEGYYNQAERLARFALAVDELVKPLVAAIGMSTSPFTLFNSLNLANALLVNGEFIQAEKILAQALVQTESLPDFQMSLTPLILSHMATVVLYRGDFVRAADMLDRSLTIKRNRLQLAGLSDDERMSLELGVAADLYTTGGLLEKRRQYDRAEICFVEAMGLVENFADALDGDGELKSNFLNGLADLYLKLGRGREAEPLIYEAHTLRKKKFSDDHPIMSSSYDNLGRFKTLIGEYDEATKLLERAAKIRRNYGRKNPSDLADTLRSLSQLKSAQGDYNQAEKYLTEALDCKLKVFGRDFPDVAEIMEEQAILWRKLERGSEADKAAADAAEIRAKFAAV